ncbi:MAG: hypothetical protein AAF367_20375 [Pseudomonadota bacterium]
MTDAVNTSLMNEIRDWLLNSILPTAEEDNLSIHSNVLQRCHSSPDPNLATISSALGIEIALKWWTESVPAFKDTQSLAKAVFPKPEAPVRTTNRRLPDYGYEPDRSKNALCTGPINLLRG